MGFLARPGEIWVKPRSSRERESGRSSLTIWEGTKIERDPSLHPFIPSIPHIAVPKDLGAFRQWLSRSYSKDIVRSPKYTQKSFYLHCGHSFLGVVRDRSLIMGGGAYKMKKLRVRNFVRAPPPLSRPGKTFLALPL